MTIVYIPTRGRVGKQPTYDALAPSGIECVLVCPPDELVGHTNAGYKAFPCKAEGVAATRQAIMGYAEQTKVMMFDDDLRFAVRRLDAPTKFVPAQTKDIRVMLDRMETMLDQVPLVGLCNRGGANNTPRNNIPVAMNKRIFDVQCYDVEWFHREGIQFRQQFMEDFDVCLQAALKGFPTAMLTTHTKDNIGGAQAGGGCSIYRTMEGQEKAARQLAERFPGFVTLREVKASGVGEWATRIDVKVMWVEAAKAGRELRDLLGMEQHPTPDWEGIAPEWTLL